MKGGGAVRISGAEKRRVRTPVASGGEGALIAVVIPVFKHSVFVSDAIDSALAQNTQCDVRIVIVDDGCPHEETRHVLLGFRAAFPDRVFYIRRPNGGLSAARNTGIEFALKRWPQLRAIYLLDSDNEIEPFALQRAWHVLQNSPATGWVYPDIAMNGSSFDYWDYGGPYSKLRHLYCNVSEAGSMIRAEVFEAGCRFDETMKSGFEDWEFWWQALDKGFAGAHAPFMGLRYRKRPESMLSGTERQREDVIRSMRRKHRALFAPRALLALEAEEFPRYAIFESSLRLCTDVRERGAAIPAQEFAAMAAAALAQPGLNYAPNYIIFATDGALDALRVAQLDRAALFWIERALRDTDAGPDASQMAVVEIARSAHAGQLRWLDQTDAMPFLDMRKVRILAIPLHALAQGSAIRLDACLTALDSALPHGAIKRLRIEGLSEIPGAGNDVIFEASNGGALALRLRELMADFQTCFAANKSDYDSPKPRSNPDFSFIAQNIYRQIDVTGMMPISATAGRSIVFVLPVLSFGGVEKVALHMAGAFKRAGWACRLLILAREGQVDAEWLETFDDVAFFHDESMYRWDSGAQFMGSAYPVWNGQGDTRALESFLIGFDAIFNFHSAALSASLAKLRATGALVLTSLHVNDQTLAGRDVGHPFLSLGHEHVHDYFVCCSQQMSDWCHAFGVPQDKVVLALNAPAHRVNIALAKDAAQVRKLRTRTDRLRVLVLGRLDRQKGLDRLAEIFEMTTARNLPIDWRIVGGAVMQDDRYALPPAMARAIERPVYSHDDLAAVFAWTDVLIMPSLWEGLPLTLLECAPYGVVALTSDAGAIEEAFDDGVTGIIIRESAAQAFAAKASDILQRLCEDRDWLLRLSEAARARPVRTWEQACAPLLQILNARLDARDALSK